MNPTLLYWGSSYYCYIIIHPETQLCKTTMQGKTQFFPTVRFSRHVFTFTQSTTSGYQICGVFSPQQQGSLPCLLGVLQFNSILTPFTWRQWQIQQGKGSVLEDCSHPTSDANNKQQVPRLTTTFVLFKNGGQFTDPMTPSSGLLNLQQQLTGLKFIYLSLPVYKGYCIGQR